MPSEPNSDQELAARAVRRDSADSLRTARTAFADLYQRHAGAVLAFLAARLGRHDAEDILQAAWLKAWEKLAGFDGQHFRGWLFTIARNLMEDQRRKKREAPLPDDAGPASRSHADGDVLREERQRVLAECLGQLSADRAELVRARLGGEDYPALASRLGLSTEQVHRRFHSAKELLQQCVEQKLT